MNDKYYTPDIEEFHLGFEYLLEEEFLDEEGCAYYEEREKVFSVGDTITFNRCVRVNDYSLYHISVKYLDKEDIESLGFKEDAYNGVKCFTKNNCQIFFFPHNIMPDCNIVSIDLFAGEFRNQYFRGLVKNKSELKTIIKQIANGI